jgi:hypothetical protein
MSYTVNYVEDKDSILQIIENDLKVDLTITYPGLSDAIMKGLRETYQYYENNSMYLDDANKSFGLVVAKKNDVVIGAIWLHFHDDYATFIGIRSTIPYLLEKLVDKTLQPLSSILIPYIVQEARNRNVKTLYCDPLLSMKYILPKYHGFALKKVDYDIHNLYGWGCDFVSNIDPEIILCEKKYAEERGETFDDSVTKMITNFYYLNL